MITVLCVFEVVVVTVVGVIVFFFGGRLWTGNWQFTNRAQHNNEARRCSKSKMVMSRALQ